MTLAQNLHSRRPLSWLGRLVDYESEKNVNSNTSTTLGEHTETQATRPAIMSGLSVLLARRSMGPASITRNMPLISFVAKSQSAPAHNCHSPPLTFVIRTALIACHSTWPTSALDTKPMLLIVFLLRCTWARTQLAQRRVLVAEIWRPALGTTTGVHRCRTRERERWRWRVSRLALDCETKRFELEI